MTTTTAAFAATVFMLGLPSANAFAAATWTTTAMPWKVSQTNAPLHLPADVAIPDQAYAYAAYSAPVNVFGKTEPVVLRVKLKVLKGQVGALLIDAGGSKQLSTEAVLKPSAADAYVYFRIRPGMAPGAIVLRNYNAPGQPGLARLEKVEFVREADLDNDELTAVVNAGLH